MWVVEVALLVLAHPPELDEGPVSLHAARGLPAGRIVAWPRGSKLRWGGPMYVPCGVLLQVLSPRSLLLCVLLPIGCEPQFVIAAFLLARDVGRRRLFLWTALLLLMG